MLRTCPEKSNLDREGHTAEFGSDLYQHECCSVALTDQN